MCLFLRQELLAGCGELIIAAWDPVLVKGEELDTGRRLCKGDNRVCVCQPLQATEQLLAGSKEIVALELAVRLDLLHPSSCDTSTLTQSREGPVERRML